MKYETPEVTTLLPAINAVQSVKDQITNGDDDREVNAAYEDWED